MEDEDFEYERDAYGHTLHPEDLDVASEEDEEARRDDDAAKLWPGGYDNL